jgi:hypothetical protein
LRTLGQRDLEARVVFAATGRHYANRKEAARATQGEVELLRSVFAGQSSIEAPTDPLGLTRAG